MKDVGGLMETDFGEYCEVLRSCFGEYCLIGQIGV